MKRLAQCKSDQYILQACQAENMKACRTFLGSEGVGKYSRPSKFVQYLLPRSKRKDFSEAASSQIFRIPSKGESMILDDG